MVNKFEPYKIWTKQSKFNESTKKFINQRIKQRGYKTLGTSVMYNLMSSLMYTQQFLFTWIKPVKRMEKTVIVAKLVRLILRTFRAVLYL